MRIDPDQRDDATQHYIERMNRAVDYVMQHLESNIKLDDVAAAAHISPFHFHRIFKALFGETLNQFIKRVRLERSLKLLAHNKSKNLTHIATACGFNSLSDFSRSFKQRYGVAPRDFNLQDLKDQRREELQTAMYGPDHRHQLGRLPVNENPDGFVVTMREIPPRTVAYIRVLRPYEPGRVDGAAERLMAWAEPLGYADNQWLGYMWEDADIVAMEDCRYDVAVEVPDVKPTGEIGRYEFPAMTVAEIELRGPIELEMRAIDYLYGTWLPASKYVPADLPAFEAWIGRPFAHGFTHFELHAQIPVARAR